MKTPIALCSGWKAVVVVVVLAGGVISRAQVTPASMSIAPVSGNARVTVNDPDNHLWVLQSSTNLTTWSEAAVWKVYNGNFHGVFSAPPGARGVFYRAFFDSSKSDIPNTTANALHLPGFPFNYASP